MPPFLRSPTFAAVLLVAAAALAWSNTLRAPFIFDDRAAIVDNPTIRDLGDLGRVLSPPADGRAVGGRPIVNLTFALNHAWSGDDPWSYHFLNLAIHALAGVVLFGLARRVLSHRATTLPPGANESGAATTFAFALALLWTLHPLQTESVTCVVQRTESLCGLFYLLVLYALARASAAPRSTPWLVASVAACWLGMGTKEVMVTAPLVALLLDRTFLAGSLAEAWRRRRGYYLALAASWLLLLGLLIGTGGTRGTAAGLGSGVSSWSYLLRQTEAIVHYLRLAVWPRPLVLDYGTKVPASLGEVIGPALVVIALLGATGWALVRRPVAGFFGAAFFLLLAPSSSFVPLAAQTMAERRMYLPLAAVLAGVLGVVLARGGRAAWWAVVMLALVAGEQTWERNEVYRSERALWTDTVAHVPGNVRAQVNLGAALLEAGDLSAAVAAFEQAQRVQPNVPEVHANLCHAYARLGKFESAVAQGEWAVRLAPDAAAARSSLAEALYGWGNTQAAARDFAAAITAYRRAVSLAPDYAPARNNLANALLITGAIDEAVAEYREVLRLRPDDAAVNENLQQALALKAAR